MVRCAMLCAAPFLFSIAPTHVGAAWVGCCLRGRVKPSKDDSQFSRFFLETACKMRIKFEYVLVLVPVGRNQIYPYPEHVHCFY